jgi:hypothetical protein
MSELEPGRLKFHLTQDGIDFYAIGAPRLDQETMQWVFSCSCSFVVGDLTSVQYSETMHTLTMFLPHDAEVKILVEQIGVTLQRGAR